MAIRHRMTNVLLILVLAAAARAQGPGAPWRPLDEKLPPGVAAFEAAFEGPLRALLVTADLGRDTVELKPILSRAPSGKEPLTTLAAGAVAAINASFFDMESTPCRVIGWLVIDGAKLADPTSFVTQKETRYPVARAAVVVASSRTPAFRWVREQGGRIVLSDDPVPNRTGAAAPEPRTGEPAAQVRHALAAGPMLLRDGKKRVTREEERMFVADRRHPRTALGRRGTTLFLLVVEGRCAASRGVTLDELAGMLLDLGATDALNLDGGGSTTLVLNGRLANRPLGGTFERPVPTALALVPRKADAPRD